MVGEMVEGRLLEKRASGRYVVGHRLWDVGLLAPVQSGVRELASPFLHDIYAATLATVHLAVRDGDQVLYLARLSGHASVPIVSTVGSRLPMSTTAVGKALLADAPAEVVARVLTKLPRPTPYSITRPGQLENELARVREQGYAVTQEEMSLGACSIAVPIQSHDNRAVAAIGIVVPSLRRGKTRLLASLQVAAQGIERSLRTNR